MKLFIASLVIVVFGLFFGITPQVAAQYDGDPVLACVEAGNESSQQSCRDCLQEGNVWTGLNCISRQANQLIPVFAFLVFFSGLAFVGAVVLRMNFIHDQQKEK